MEDDEIARAAAGPMLPFILEVLASPQYIHPTRAAVLLHVLQERLPLDGAMLAPLPSDASSFIGTTNRTDGSSRVNRAHNGVALIPIIGTLVNRGSWIGSKSGMTSYDGLKAQLREAVSDPEIKSIILDINSPGGEASGMMSVADLVQSVAREKMITAVVNDMAASAAYGIASAANEIVVSPTSTVGSIGVVFTHLDKSAQFAREGIKPTLIYAGKHKVDGNPFGPLSEAIHSEIQAEVLDLYDQFVGLVARGRSRLTEQSIRDTEAKTYRGKASIDLGLADRVASIDEILSEQSTMARGATSKRSWFAMSNTKETAAPQAEIAGISAEAHAAALAVARAEGAAAERARIAAIMTAEAAEGREKQAMAFAFDTDLDAEQAVKVLSVAPKEVAARSTVPSIAERAAAEREFGAAPSEPAIGQKSASLWANAVKSANTAIGVKR